MHKLFSFTTPQRAAQIRSKAEMAMKVACCSRGVCKYPTADMAVGVLINACEEEEMGEEFLDFVPPFLLTDGARRCNVELREFMLRHVQPHHREAQRRQTQRSDRDPACHHPHPCRAGRDRCAPVNAHEIQEMRSKQHTNRHSRTCKLLSMPFCGLVYTDSVSFLFSV